MRAKWVPPSSTGDSRASSRSIRGKKYDTAISATALKREALIERIWLADIFIQTSGPNVPAKFRHRRADAHPALSATDLCRPRRFGHLGPWKGAAGANDPISQAVAGMVISLNGDPAGPGVTHRRLHHRPVNRPFGRHRVLARFHGDGTGQGSLVNTSLFESGLIVGLQPRRFVLR